MKVERAKYPILIKESLEVLLLLMMPFCFVIFPFESMADFPEKRYKSDFQVQRTANICRAKYKYDYLVQRTVTLKLDESGKGRIFHYYQ